jgi:dodecin
MAVAKVTEIISSSKKSFEDAIANGISRSSKTLKNITGAWISEQKVVVEKGKIVEWRVIMRVTFVLEK